MKAILLTLGTVIATYSIFNTFTPETVHKLTDLEEKSNGTYYVESVNASDMAEGTVRIYKEDLSIDAWGDCRTKECGYGTVTIQKQADDYVMINFEKEYREIEVIELEYQPNGYWKIRTREFVDLVKGEELIHRNRKTFIKY